MKILVVEDDPVTSHILMGFLAEFGDCQLVKDGASALREFIDAHEAGDPYQIVCLDIVMPLLNGHSVLEEIRREEALRHVPPGEGTKVVMITSVLDKSNVVAAFDGGCEEYLVKPFTKEKLVRAIRRLGFSESP